MLHLHATVVVIPQLRGEEQKRATPVCKRFTQALLFIAEKRLYLIIIAFWQL